MLMRNLHVRLSTYIHIKCCVKCCALYVYMCIVCIYVLNLTCKLRMSTISHKHTQYTHTTHANTHSHVNPASHPFFDDLDCIMYSAIEGGGSCNGDAVSEAEGEGGHTRLGAVGVNAKDLNHRFDILYVCVFVRVC